MLSATGAHCLPDLQVSTPTEAKDQINGLVLTHCTEQGLHCKHAT